MSKCSARTCTLICGPILYADPSSSLIYMLFLLGFQLLLTSKKKKIKSLWTKQLRSVLTVQCRSEKVNKMLGCIKKETENK